MTTNHIDQLTEWWENAEVPTRATLPNDGDRIIIRYNSEWYEVATSVGDAAEHEITTDTRILARASKPKPAWHNAPAVIATGDAGDGDLFTGVWIPHGSPEWWECADVGIILGSERLYDVTPLIEAKVTDEMVVRAVATVYGIAKETACSELYEDERDDVRVTVSAALGIVAE